MAKNTGKPASKKKAAQKKAVNTPETGDKKKAGRPSVFSEELILEICEVIATSNKGLHTICRENPHFPSVSTIFDWLQNKPGFSEMYARAKAAQAHLLVEQILEISDDTSGDIKHTDTGIIENKEFVNRSRLKIDARKWLAAKLLPKVYGDKLDLTSGGDKIANSAPPIIQVINPGVPNFASDESEIEGKKEE